MADNYQPFIKKMSYVWIIILSCNCVASQFIPSAPAYIFTMGNNICSYNTSTKQLPLGSKNCFWYANNSRSAVFDMVLSKNLLIVGHSEVITQAVLAEPNSTAALKLNKTLVRSAGVMTDIAVDWVAGNIYYVDSTRKSINIVNLNGDYAVTIHQSISGLWSIAVDPVTRYLFWTNPYAHTQDGAIARSNLDGSSKQSQFITSVISPFRICVDHNERRLYWTDTVKGTIESSDLDGKNHRVIVESIYKYPSSLTVSQNYVIWTEYLASSFYAGIYWTSKVSGNHSQYKTHRTLNRIHDIIYYSEYTQPKGHTNGCSGNYGGCSQICLPTTSTSVVCKCSLGFQLESDGKTCNPVKTTNYKNALFIADSGRGYIFTMDITTKAVSALPIPKQEDIATIVIDPIQNSIFWSNRRNKTIMKSSLDGSSLTKVVSLPEHNIHGLAIDYEKQLIFYSDYDTHLTESLSYNGGNKKVIFNENTSVSIAVDVQYQKLYMAMINTNPRIMVINYDGSHQRVLIKTRIKHPVGLTLDFISGEMYWSDRILGRIERAHLDGTMRETLHYTSRSSFWELALIGNYIYISDYIDENQLKRIYRNGFFVDVSDFGTDEFLKTTSITAYPNIKDTQNHTTSVYITTPTTSTARTTLTTTTTTISTARTKGTGSNNVNQATIIGVVIGVVALVLLVLAVAFIIYCRSKSRTPSAAAEPPVAFTNPGYASFPGSVPTTANPVTVLDVTTQDMAQKPRGLPPHPPNYDPANYATTNSNVYERLKFEA